MHLILLLARRHLLFRPAKTLLSALGIGLGIATVVAVLTVDHNTLLSQAVRRNPADPGSDLLIQPLDTDPARSRAAADELRRMDFLSGVGAHATASWTVVKGGRPRMGVEVMAVDQAAGSELAAYTVAEGRDLDFDGEAPELLMSAGVAEKAGLEVGDTVALVRQRRRGPARRCVDGELVVIGRPGDGAPDLTETHPFQVVGLLASGNLGYARHRVLTTLDQGRELFGADFSIRFWADFDPEVVDFHGAENRLREGFLVYAPERALAGQAPEEAAFRSGVRLCGFLALFLGLYIIFNTMSMSLVERVRQIGLLRALGVTRGKLLAIFLAEGATLSLLGATLSVFLTVGIVTVMERMRITTLGFGKPLEIREVPWGPALAVLAAGVLFSLLGIVYPFLRASRLSVIDALRRGVIEMARDPFTGTRRSVLLGLLALVPVAWLVGAPGGVVAVPMYEAFLQAVGVVGGAMAVLLMFNHLLPRLALLLLRPLRGPSVVLTRSTVQSSRHRVFATVTGLMLVFAAVFLVVSVLESLKSETRQFARVALEDRVFIRTTPEGATRLDRVREANPELRNLTPVNVEITSPFLVRALDKRVLNVGRFGGDADARREFGALPRIIMSTRCADDFGYAPGDWVTLATRAEGPVEFQVLAVTDEYGFAPDDRVFAAVSTENMQRYWCQDGVGTGGWFVAWAPRIEPERRGPMLASVREIIGEDDLLHIKTGEQVGDEYLTDLDRDFRIFYAILILTVMLAAIGVLNAMAIAVMERRREIGLLRAVGLTAGQVARMLLVESGAFGVLGGLLGLMLGIPLATITARALTALSHLDLIFELSPRAVTAVLGGAILVALLAVLYPALRANRLRLSEVMRYE